MGDNAKYLEIVNISKKIFEPVKDIIKTDFYEEEYEVLQSVAYNKAIQKVDYYRKKIAKMEQKYNVDFFTFGNKVNLRAEDDFEKLDDSMLWRGYIKAYCYWEQFC